MVSSARHLETWQRARGWALWKALITLVEFRHTDARKADEARCVITVDGGDPIYPITTPTLPVERV